MKIRQQHAIALAIDEQERLLPAIHTARKFFSIRNYY